MERGELVADDLMVDAGPGAARGRPDARTASSSTAFPGRSRRPWPSRSCWPEMDRRISAVVNFSRPRGRRSRSGCAGARGAETGPTTAPEAVLRAAARLPREDRAAGRLLPRARPARRRATATGMVARGLRRGSTRLLGVAAGRQGGGHDHDPERGRARRSWRRPRASSWRPRRRRAGRRARRDDRGARPDRRGGDPPPRREARRSWATGGTRRRSAPRSTTRSSTASRAARVLREGDILGVDCGAVDKGYYGDAARTVAGRAGSTPSGRASASRRGEALEAGIAAARPGGRVSDIGARSRPWRGARLWRRPGFVGHGIGTALHEEPQVPNYGRPAGARCCKAGMVIAIEPMFNRPGRGRASTRTAGRRGPRDGSAVGAFRVHGGGRAAAAP